MSWKYLLIYSFNIETWQVIHSEVVNQFYMKWKKWIHRVIHVNRIHVDHRQRAEVMVAHLLVSAYKAILEHHRIVVPNVLLTMTAHPDLLALITNAKIHVLDLVEVNTKFLIFCNGKL